MPGRINYNSIDIDFERKWNQFNVFPASNNAESVSQSGISQIGHFYEQDFIAAIKNNISGTDKAQLDDWFTYVGQGNSFLIEMDRNIGTYISFEGKSLNTNDATAGTFTRTGTATYFDPSTTYLTSITANDTARFPGGKYGSGTIVEGARTNLITESRDMTTTWTTNGTITPSASTAETKDLYDANGASKVVVGTDDSSLQFTTSTAITTNDASFRVFMKSDQGDVSVTLRIWSTSTGDIANNTVTVIPNGSLANGFEEYKVNYESGGSIAGNWEVYIEGDTGSTTIYVDEAQLEVGSGVLYPTQPISTTGGTGTRNAELLLYSTTNIINQDKGGIDFWLSPAWVYNKQEGNLILFQCGDSAASADQFIDIRMLASGTIQFIMRLANSSTAAATATWSATTLSQNTFSHLAFTYDRTVSNGLNIYEGGVLRGTSTNDPFLPTDIGANFAIGSDVDGGNQCNCIFDEVTVSKNVLTATDINHIYNRGHAKAIGRNRWTSALLQNYTWQPNRKFSNRFDVSILAKEVIT